MYNITFDFFYMLFYKFYSDDFIHTLKKEAGNIH